MMTKRKLGDDFQPSTSQAKKICPDILPPLPPIDPGLEKLVFTHPSVAQKTTDETNHYDRLEFLGDAHIELLASNLIYDTFPTASAGRMAQIRQQLVQNETLAQYSKAYEFDKKLRINVKQTHIAKTPFTKIYGDVFEAYVGAIFRSDFVNGPAQAEEWVKKLWQPQITEFKREMPPDLRGIKEDLAKRVMVPGIKLDYVNDRPPLVHKGKGTETFYVGIYLTGWGYTNQHLGSGKANSKTRAGQEAALQALANTKMMDELETKKRQYMENAERSKSQNRN